MSDLTLMGENAKKTAYILSNLSSNQKNEGLLKISKKLIDNQDRILAANLSDLKNAKGKSMSDSLIDRLLLNEKRIVNMADSIKQLLDLPDPIGEVISMWTRPNGLQIGQQRVPLGVIGIIYEARPNVTVDAATLCLKAGNAVILRGGSEALNSNKVLVSLVNEALNETDFPEFSVQLLEDTNHETVIEMMKLNKYIDVLIPRGGAGLIQTVVQNSTIPVIETGTGNCHVYVDRNADLAMGQNIIINAKTSRPGVCNAAETLLVDETLAKEFLPEVIIKLKKLNVEIRGCEKTREICSDIKPATEEDWKTEYLDYILAVKVVRDIDEAIAHINEYGTKHSEAIVTNDYNKARKFLKMVDAAAVYVNASTRFTDGFEFGFGAEIGISTQKLHARGPMGLKELTTIKYIIYGDGQTR